MEVLIKQFLSCSDWGDGPDWGDGSGFGSGSGFGDGYGNGSGFGFGIKSYNGHEAYIIDGMQTIIYSVHGNIARGAIINSDLTLADCYIAKCGDYFAHGETAKQAMADAQSKAYQNKPIEERVDYVVKKYPDVDAPSNTQFFSSYTTSSQAHASSVAKSSLRHIPSTLSMVL